MIVIAGKNDIAVHGLILAIEHFDQEKIIVVVNRNDRGVDHWQRSLLKVATENNIIVKTLSEVYETDIDYFLSLEFDQIIDPNKLNTDKVYNIHFSQLPKYKGMYTSVWPILYADSHSGVTLHKIDEGIDTGDIIAQKVFELSEKDRSQDCYRKYIDNSKVLLSEWFCKLVNNEVCSVEQSAINATYFSKKTIDYSNLSIDFNKTAWQVKRQVYAFSFRPYQLLSFGDKDISDVIIKKEKSLCKPGTIIAENEDFLTVSTIDYDVELYFDGLDSFLASIPSISVNSFCQNLTMTLGVNDRNSKGWSPIIVAAYHGRRDLVEFLLDKGADINDRNYRGTTVLMYAKDYALKNNDYSFFKFLVEQGADFSLKDWSGKSLPDYISIEQAKLLGVPT
ncbi:formyltransferase family protein [Psychrobacter submarinus]|uniref:formyltransferase family protein n=1 Tax=Psychrobacter submarinus TaxID=154108 RepID=UPI00191A5221|nr:formyltransferase family protein [Psychrobacter submarinus]